MTFTAKLVLAAAVAVALPSAQAQAVPHPGAPSGKIGFINTERILRDSQPAKLAQQQLESEFAKRNQKIQQMAARLKSLNQKLDKDGPVLSDADRAALQQQISDLNLDLQRRQREFGEDLNARRNAELAAVLAKANKVVKDVAQQGNYDIIFQDAVYANPRIDITDKVLKALDAGR